MILRSSLPVASLVLVAVVNAAACGPALAARASHGDEGRLATLTAVEVKGKLPPAATTVVLRPLDAKGEGDAFSFALDRALRGAGYAVAEPARAPRGAEVVRYAVTPAWDGYVVQLSIQGQTTARFYRQSNDGALVSAGPATVREAD